MYKPCSKFDGKFETKKAVFLCNDGLGHPGQFVYIRDDREEQEYFGLCEVEVFEYRSKWYLIAAQSWIFLSSASSKKVQTMLYNR
jgi:hypothetical protein